ncbi:MAG: hypothetical protein KAT58_02755 [candidate division Zixibacteria bacterium]|nr:hypothetical protein [candidate division Zixibacteria bacterium]
MIISWQAYSETVDRRNYYGWHTVINGTTFWIAQGDIPTCLYMGRHGRNLLVLFASADTIKAMSAAEIMGRVTRATDAEA